MRKTQFTQRGQRRTKVDIGNAEKKLRQATFFLSHLELAPRDIARSLARAVPDQSEMLEYYFSACLSSAQSVFYTLEKAAGRRFGSIESEWRNSLASDEERARFHSMKRMRDDDIHYGESGAESLSAMIPANPDEYYVSHNAVLLGPPALASHTNADGAVIVAPALRGTQRLYVVLNGQRVDSTTACRSFIGQLRSLQAAVLAALQG